MMKSGIDCIRDRRSIRKYKDIMPDRRVIDDILSAAALAPSAKNRQPWKYIVYSGSEKDKLIMAMEKGLNREQSGDALLPESAFALPDAWNTLRIMREAPVIVAVINTNGRTPYENIDTDERISEICDTLSIGASIQNMLIRACELGVGSLWIANTCFAYTELMDFIGTKYQLVSAIALGYADEAPAKRPRKDMEEVVEYR